MTPNSYEAKHQELMQSLEEIFRDNYSRLYSCAYRMIGNHQDTEDVLQNSFTKAYKNIGKFKGQSKMYTWVYRIVINESYRYFEYIHKLPLTRITKDLGMNEREFFGNIENTPNFDDELIIDEMREKCLQAFLKCLPKNQRVCFLLKTCLHLKNQDIAEILDLSIENVKVTLHRGRKKLQEILEMRCSLIDPEKPCKCYLWIKFMRDHNLPIPEGHCQFKAEELKKEHFKNMSLLKKIDYLYTVEGRLTKDQFIDKLKRAAEIL